jgi:hypothetical protein
MRFFLNLLAEMCQERKIPLRDIHLDLSTPRPCFRAVNDLACLLNASRGTVVDLEALAAAIRSGQVGGAAIDVYPEEPESNSDGFGSVLRGLPNVVLTPHIGGSTEEAQARSAARSRPRSHIRQHRRDDGRGELPAGRQPLDAGAPLS